MPLHYSRDGYRFRADADGLTIEPGRKPVTLSRQELAQLGLGKRDDCRIPIIEGQKAEEKVTERIFSALQETLMRCQGPEEIWMAQDLKRAMILVGGLDEEVAQSILDQELCVKHNPAINGPSPFATDLRALAISPRYNVLPMDLPEDSIIFPHYTITAICHSSKSTRDTVALFPTTIS